MNSPTGCCPLVSQYEYTLNWQTRHIDRQDSCFTPRTRHGQEGRMHTARQPTCWVLLNVSSWFTSRRNICWLYRSSRYSFFLCHSACSRSRNSNTSWIRSSICRQCKQFIVKISKKYNQWPHIFITHHIKLLQQTFTNGLVFHHSVIHGTNHKTN